MNKKDIKRLLILNVPYILVGLFATNLGEAWRLAEGADSSAKILLAYFYPADCLAEPYAQLLSSGFAGGHYRRCRTSPCGLPESEECQEV